MKNILWIESIIKNYFGNWNEWKYIENQKKALIRWRTHLRKANVNENPTNYIIIELKLFRIYNLKLQNNSELPRGTLNSFSGTKYTQKSPFSGTKRVQQIDFLKPERWPRDLQVFHCIISWMGLQVKWTLARYITSADAHGFESMEGASWIYLK